MSRAKLTFENRLYIECALMLRRPKMDICKHLGISSMQLKWEIDLGWIEEEKRYSAEKAQLSLK